MKIIAVEFSSDVGSVALLDDDRLIAAMSVDARNRRSQEIFSCAEQCLASAGWTFADVEAIAVGRGPGNYTGLRVSLTAAHGWALPAKKPVWTVSSAAALAAEIFAERPECAQLVASGPARRGTLWTGCFARGAGAHPHPQPIGDWKTMPTEDFGKEWPEAQWIEPRRTPTAQWVGHLFFAGIPSEEHQPIYLHPAVATPPRQQ